MENILKKLLAISKEVETMPKDGHNDFQNYNYLSETQVSLKMRELLNKHGVVFLHSTKQLDLKEWKNAKDAQKFLTVIEINYQFIDVESAEILQGTEIGHGEDSGDKGVYKAITGAIKYIFMKTFLIPTGDDPENDKKQLKKSTPVSNRQQPAQNTTGLKPCDKCGKPFVLRKGKDGPFYGCTGYPNCKRTLDLGTAEQWKEKTTYQSAQEVFSDGSPVPLETPPYRANIIRTEPINAAEAYEVDRQENLWKD